MPFLIHRAKTQKAICPKSESASYGQGRGGRPWRRKRDRVLSRDGYLCQVCKAQGRITEATEVDHIKGLAQGGTDSEDNLQAICTPCHKIKTASESNLTPALIPKLSRKPLIPVVIVCGPPGSGKTHYIRAHAGKHDLIIDSGSTMQEIAYRNAQLSALANTPMPYDRCWLSLSAPTWTERSQWVDMLCAKSIVLTVSPDTCIKRIQEREDIDRLTHLIHQWWKNHSTGFDDEVIR